MTSTSTSTQFNYSTPITKAQILERLFKADQITFDELWTLMQDNEGTRYLPSPYPYPHPFHYYPDSKPPIITFTDGTP